MKVRDFCFADAAIDALAVAIDLNDHLLATSEIQHVYDSTGSGSQLRRLIVHEYVELADKCVVDTSEAVTLALFHADLARACLRRLTTIEDRRVLSKSLLPRQYPYRNVDGCKYHQHPRDQPDKCYRNVLEPS